MNELKYAHGLLGQTLNDLREIWLEIPGDCHLNCDYCLAFEDKKNFHFLKKARIDQRADLLTIEEELNILRQFVSDFPLTVSEKKAGLKKQVAIPASGEPFFTPKMRAYLYPIIEFCEDNDLLLSIFTTGDLINDQDIEFLKPKKNIRIIVKLNSFQAKIQDRLVKRSGYTQARDQMLQKLIAEGFNDGRLGIVTSLMPSNLDEAENILLFARENNLTFDMDMIITRGRGEKSGQMIIDKQKISQATQRLQEIDKKYNRFWQPSISYIGSPPCTRFSYHLYIQGNGQVSPCISSTQIVYGNLRENTLKNLWNSKLSQIIRRHDVQGVCRTCKNFGHTCFSCLSRSTKNLSAEKILGCQGLPTIGCQIFGPI